MHPSWAPTIVYGCVGLWAVGMGRTMWRHGWHDSTDKIQKRRRRNVHQEGNIYRFSWRACQKKRLICWRQCTCAIHWLLHVTSVFGHFSNRCDMLQTFLKLLFVELTNEWMDGWVDGWMFQHSALRWQVFGQSLAEIGDQSKHWSIDDGHATWLSSIDLPWDMLKFTDAVCVFTFGRAS